MRFKLLVAINLLGSYVHAAPTPKESPFSSREVGIEDRGTWEDQRQPAAVGSINAEETRNRDQALNDNAKRDSDKDDDEDDAIYKEMDQLLEDIAKLPKDIAEGDPKKRYKWLVEQGHEEALHKFLKKYHIPDTGDINKDLLVGYENYVKETEALEKRSLGDTGAKIVDVLHQNQIRMGCVSSSLAFLALNSVPVYKGYRLWRLAAAEGGMKAVAKKVRANPDKFFHEFGKGKHRKPYSTVGKHSKTSRHSKPQMHKPGAYIKKVGFTAAWGASAVGMTPQIMVWCFGIRPPF